MACIIALSTYLTVPHIMRYVYFQLQEMEGSSL